MASRSVGKKPAQNTPSRTSLENNDEAPSILMLAWHLIAEINVQDEANHVQMEALRSNPPVGDNINVQEYEIRKQMAPLLKAIFNKYGDIAKQCTFTMESRSYLLELVCSIYKRLEASKFTQLTPLDLKSMLAQIGDLESVKVDVEWLRRRIDLISKAQQMGVDGSTPEEIKARCIEEISKRQKEYEDFKAVVEEWREKVQQRLDGFCAAQSFSCEIINIIDESLVHGLV